MDIKRKLERDAAVYITNKKNIHCFGRVKSVEYMWLTKRHRNEERIETEKRILKGSRAFRKADKDAWVKERYQTV